jgi:peptidoglycan-associated lipoprotein
MKSAMSKMLAAAAVGIALGVVSACSSTPVTPAAPVDTATPTTAPPPVATTPAPPAVIASNPLDDPKSILARRSVYFDLDKYDVKPEFQPLVQAHAKYLAGNPGARIAIEGNCDESGSREYNLALGQKRADAVKNAMKLLGAQETQMESVSFGKEKPRATGHDEAAHAENRRDDLDYKVKL